MRGLTERMHRGARRAVSEHDARVHVGVREVDDDDREALAARLRERLERIEGVRWARYNAYLARVVVERDPERVPLEVIVREIERVEAQLCASVRFARSMHTYPGDREPERRKWIELVADTMSLGLSTALRLKGVAQTPHDIDFAAITAVLDGVPRIKKSMEQGVSLRAADLTLELLKSASMLAVRSEAGPLSALLSHALHLREQHARRAVWMDREAELCAERDHHAAVPRAPKQRPAPLRKGPIERYEQASIPASLGVYGASLFFTRDSEGSAPSIFAGLPRAARHGRASFVAHLGFLLAKRGVLVFDPAVLERLDRIDTIAIEAELAASDPRDAARIARRARELDLAVHVIGERAGSLDWPAEELTRTKRSCKAVRRLQRSGGGVLSIARGPSECARAADVALALSSDPPPWGAHVVARHGVEDALLLIDAVAQARRVAIESVVITMSEAATALAISAAGLDRQTTRRVMTVANAASMIAMINGVRLAHALDVPVPAPPKDATPYHAMDPDAVLGAMSSSRAGLSSLEAQARRVPRPPPRSSLASFGRALAEELVSPLTAILTAGAGLSAAVGSVVDAGLIATALGINGMVGAAQRFGARRAIDALETREERAAKVMRDGQLIEAPRDELVPGDIVELGAGEIVPADCRLIEAQGVEVDESSLTGESLPVPKDARAVQTDVVAERTSMIYQGTSIAAGCARAVVVAIGEDTEVGRAHGFIEQRVRPRGVEARLEELATITGPVAGASALGIMGAGLARGRPFAEVVTSAVGLGVAAVPEGLPILSTLAQLAAARRLTRRGALVRNPRSLEALGRVDVLCADKTGTLTEGKIRLELVSDGGRPVDVASAGAPLREVIAVALRASPERNGDGPLAHPTDEALVRGAEEAGITLERDGHGYERGPELPFEPGRGFHASIGVDGDACVLSVKGAPEIVLPRCERTRAGKLKKRERKHILARAREIGRKGYRVLAVAERALPRRDGLCDAEVSELSFLGLVGLADPVRASSRAALRDLSDAGVRVVMLTGDHPSTAEAIAEELDLPSHEVVTGADIDALDDDALADRLERASIFARVTPAQKVRLVRVLAARGKTVAMTGDGANDAAAIALADVGIAVGAQATGAARSVADLVVTDGRIETIVDAILEGRGMWASVRDAVSILVGGNFGEIAFTLLPGLLTGRAPLNARQLLLVNLVTDTLPSLAIAISPPRREDLERLLREGPEASLGGRLDRDLVVRAAITGSAAAAAYTMSRLTGGGPARAGTVGLVALTGAQLGQTLIAGGRNVGVLGAAVGSLAALFAVIEIPGVSHFFGCRPLGPVALTQAIGTTVAATAVAWALPRWLERREARPRRTSEALPIDRISLVEEDEPLFGGLLEAA